MRHGLSSVVGVLSRISSKALKARGLHVRAENDERLGSSLPWSCVLLLRSAGVLDKKSQGRDADAQVVQ